MVVCVYLLMRTRIEGWLRGASGAPETRGEGVVRRVEAMKRREREGVGRGGDGEGEGVSGGIGVGEVKKDR